MAINQDLVVQVRVDSRGAVQSLNLTESSISDVADSARDADRATDQLSDGFRSLGSAVVVANQALELAKKAYTAIAGAVKATTDAYQVQEKAEQKIAIALKQTGQFSQEALEGFRQYAAELQSVTTLGDETTLSLLAQSIALGNSAEKSMQLVEAASDVSSAFDNLSLESAFINLNKTLGGTVGELGEVLPELKELTAEQLKSGEAIDLVSKKFAGFSKNLTQTFGGSLQQATNNFGDSLEEIGRLIVEVFDIAALLNQLSTAIQTVTQTISNLRMALKQVDFEGLFSRLNDLLLITAAILVGKIAPAVASVAAAYGPILISQTLLIGKIALITAGVLGIATAVEFVFKNFSQLLDLVDLIEAGFRSLFAFIIKGFKGVVSDILDFFLIGFKPLTLLPGQLGKDFAQLGPTIKESLGVLDDFSEQQFVKAEKAALRFQNTAGEFEDTFLSKALKEGQKFVTNFTNGANEIKADLSGVTGLSDKLGTSLDNVAAQAKQAFDAVGKLNDTRLELLRAEGNEVEAAKLAGQLRLKAFDEAIAKSARLNESQRQAAEEARKNIEKINAINIQKATARTSTGTTGSTMLGSSSEPEQDLKITRLFSQDDIKNIGDQLGESIASGAESLSSAISPALAAMEAANAVVSGLQKVVDFIPQFLDGVTNLVSSITDLPMKILESVTGLLDSLVNFVADFIPNIIKAVPEIVQRIIEFLATDLPKAFTSLIDSLPSLITGLIKKIPELASSLVEALIALVPKLSVSLVEFLVKDAPRIAFRLAEVLAIELPIAIVEGIVNGVSAALGLFGDLISNSFNTDKIEENFEAVGQTISRASSQLFQVIDDEATSRALDTADRIRDAIGQGAKRFGDIFQLLINSLVNAWRKIYELFIKPIEEIIIKAWRWVYDNILEPLGSVVAQAWHWVLDNILNPLGGFVSRAWHWVIDNVLNPLAGTVSGAWHWVLDNILNPLGSFVSEAWKGILYFFDNMGNQISKAFEGVFSFFRGLGTQVFKAFEDIFKFFRDTLGGRISSAFSSVTSFFSGFKFETPSWLQSLVDAANKLSGGKGGGDGLIVETFNRVFGQTGGLVTPTAIAMSSGGMVPQLNLAPVPGTTDSVPAMLTPGEFVMSRPAVERIGARTLSSLNSGGSLGTTNNTVIEVSMVLNTTGGISQSDIRQRILPTLKEELKKASLKGELLVSNRGVF